MELKNTFSGYRNSITALPKEPISITYEISTRNYTVKIGDNKSYFEKVEIYNVISRLHLGKIDITQYSGIILSNDKKSITIH